jgi:hypothetical protein
MDYRERSERDDFRDKDRVRDRDRPAPRAPEPSSSRRSRSRDRDDGRRRKDGRRERAVAVDEFGRVINYDREKSMSPDRPRKFDPRKLRRSESPEAEQEVMKEAPKLKNEHLFQVGQVGILDLLL